MSRPIVSRAQTSKGGLARPGTRRAVKDSSSLEQAGGDLGKLVDGGLDILAYSKGDDLFCLARAGYLRIHI